MKFNARSTGFAFLFLLVLLLGFYLGGKVYYKKENHLPLTTAEHLIYETTVVSNSIKRLWHSFFPSRTAASPPPSGLLGDNPIPIPGRLLYTQYDSTRERFLVQLHSLQENTVIKTWPLPYTKINRLYKNWLNEHIDRYRFSELHEWISQDLQKRGFRHPLLTTHGHLLFSLGTFRRPGPLVCADPEGNILWVSRVPTHHSLEMGSGDTIWTCSYLENPRNTQYTDALLALDAKTGKILKIKGIRELLLENHYPALAYAHAGYKDPFHLNDVQPVTTSGTLWQPGDLFLSLRNTNTLLLYRTSSNKVIWLKQNLTSQGWMGQHYVDVINDSVIGVFDNHILRTHGKTYARGPSRILFHQLSKDSTWAAFPGLQEKISLHSKEEGLFTYSAKDSLLYLESNGQRMGVFYDLKQDSLWTFSMDKPGYGTGFNWNRWLPEQAELP